MLPAIFTLALLRLPQRSWGVNGTAGLESGHGPILDMGPLLDGGLLMGEAGGEQHGPCRCWLEPSVPECECQGSGLDHLPGNITLRIERLTVQNSGIKVLTNDSLQPYKNTLKDLTLTNNHLLEELQPGLLHGLNKLKTLYIVHASELKSLHDDLFKVYLPNLRNLRVIYTGLTELPQIIHLQTNEHMAMVDLESNSIQRLRYQQFKISVDRLILSDNKIELIEGYAFSGSQIQLLTLRGNKQLKWIDKNAFQGIAHLRELDLSETSITFLPTTGLHQLEVLLLQQVRSLKVFPSIYNFPQINRVYLTYAYHCCAFHFPNRHDPARHAEHKRFEERMRANCGGGGAPLMTTPLLRSRRSWGASISSHLSPGEPEGVFHQEAFHNLTEIGGRKVATCGNISKDYKRVSCEPAPDAFNPCEDLMGNWTLRIAMWIVAVAALFGNTAVILVLMSSKGPPRMTVQRFLMCNLAFADLCMGVYLIMIASMDAVSIGDYFNYAIDWQNGYGCQIAGFLTVFSSELSILTLMVITSERWYTITYAIHINKRLKLGTAFKIMAGGWAYALLMALLPLLGVSGYYKTSICLPLEVTASQDMAYLAVLLSLNGVAFWVICLCYGRMYCTIRRGRESGAALNNSDMTVAKRMALLVFTDFACWAPIAFFGLTALSGYPLIDVTKSKILLVFFYPLNSCANPYLYALLTHQYRRDVLVLLSRCGLCKERAARSKSSGQTAGGAGGTRQRPTGGRGSLLTTLTSLDCARQHSLGPLPEMAQRIDSMPQVNNNGPG